MKTTLACDGPFNGQYITAAQAAEHGYDMSDWQWDGSEKVYMQPAVKNEQERRGDDGDEFARRFPYAYAQDEDLLKERHPLMDGLGDAIAAAFKWLISIIVVLVVVILALLAVIIF